MKKCLKEKKRKKNVVVDLGTNKSRMREILDLSKPTDSINNAKKIIKKLRKV